MKEKLSCPNWLSPERWELFKKNCIYEKLDFYSNKKKVYFEDLPIGSVFFLWDDFANGASKWEKEDYETDGEFDYDCAKLLYHPDIDKYSCIGISFNLEGTCPPTHMLDGECFVD